MGLRGTYGCVVYSAQTIWHTFLGVPFTLTDHAARTKDSLPGALANNGPEALLAGDR